VPERSRSDGEGTDIPGAAPAIGDYDDGSTADPAIRLAPEMTMADVEQAAIRIALREVDGNRRKAAERLGIGERTLYRKIKEYEIEV
jgi:DNA-binding NtrC family response regulator